MKKVILSVLAVLLVIALGFGGYLLLTARNLQKYVEEEVSCPYSWTEMRDGSYRLEIDTTMYPNHSWSVEVYPKNVVAATEASANAGACAFTILPLNGGQAYVQVYCEQTQPIAARVFEIGMQIGVSGNKQITVENTEHKEYDGVAKLGEKEGYPIEWWQKPDGGVNLLITGEQVSNWSIADADPEGISVSGPFYRDGSCGFEVEGLQSGIFPLTIYNGGEKILRFEILVANDLTAAITDFSAEVYLVDRSEEHNAFEAELGRELALPADAIAQKYNLKIKEGSIDFLLQEKAWRWQVAAERSLEELMGEIPAYAAETQTNKVGTVTLTAYSFEEGVAVFWKTKTSTMALYGERGSAVADALALAGQILEANNGQ